RIDHPSGPQPASGFGLARGEGPAYQQERQGGDTADAGGDEVVHRIAEVQREELPPGRQGRREGEGGHHRAHEAGAPPHVRPTANAAAAATTSVRVAALRSAASLDAVARRAGPQVVTAPTAPL